MEGVGRQDVRRAESKASDLDVESGSIRPQRNSALDLFQTYSD